jgi:hypothetical protein
MADFDLTLRELEKGRLFAIGESHVIKATIGRGHLVEMEDVQFHFDSAVMLPEPDCSDDPDKPAEERITGLAVLAACYKHAQDHPRELLVIAGHADTSGGAAGNLTLSQQRADNVFFALIGDKENWAKSSFARHQVEDVQAILKWIDVRFGFGTDPGPINNKHGEQSQAAIRAFKKRFNSDFGTKMPIDGSSLGLDGWRAFFDLYVKALGEILETDEFGIIELRGNLTFLEGKKKTLGCGENHPIEAAGKDGFRSKTNRRVELLFFDPEEKLPKLDCHPSAGKCDKDKCQIYGKGLFDFKHIPCGAPTPGFAGSFAEGEAVKAGDSDSPATQPDDAEPIGLRFLSRDFFSALPKG